MEQFSLLLIPACATGLASVPYFSVNSGGPSIKLKTNLFEAESKLH
jgi:hypothetical protein